MCGRFTLASASDLIDEHFGLPVPWPLQPRFNIAPSQPLLALRTDADGARQWAQLRWGLIPAWAKDAKIGYKMINARAETVAEKPAYRNAYRRHRCLVPADGFYEWKKLGKGKQPYHLCLDDHGLFAFAALWEHWRSPEDEEVESVTLITTEPNPVAAQVHDRMPLILSPSDYTRWLDPTATAQTLAPLLAPYSGAMRAYPVSSRVNKPDQDGAGLITEVPAIPAATDQTSLL